MDVREICFLNARVGFRAEFRVLYLFVSTTFVMSRLFFRRKAAKRDVKIQTKNTTTPIRT